MFAGGLGRVVAGRGGRRVVEHLQLVRVVLQEAVEVEQLFGEERGRLGDVEYDVRSGNVHGSVLLLLFLL